MQIINCNYRFWIQPMLTKQYEFFSKYLNHDYKRLAGSNYKITLSII